MNKDDRLYGKFTLDFADHPKIAPLSDAAFRCLVEATLWSRKQETDGRLSHRLAVARWSLDTLLELSSNDPDNPSLTKTDFGWQIHDYALHQDTKADIEKRRERNRIAGRKGGQVAQQRAKQAAEHDARQRVSEMAANSFSNSASENRAEEEEEEYKGGSVNGLTNLSAVPDVAAVPGGPPNQFCPKHPNGTETPCRACGETRRAFEAWEAAEAEAGAIARRARRAVIDACPYCDDNALREIPGGVTRCSHDPATFEHSHA